MEATELFRAAFKNLLGVNNVSQVEVANSVDITPQKISDYLNKRINFSEKKREQIAKFFGLTYLEFLNLGQALIIGKEDFSSALKASNTPTPMDPAIQILNEALEETGVKINEKQKQAVLKILREELEKSEGKTKDDIKKYLQAFGK